MSTISSHFANDDFLGLFIAKMSTMFEKTESDMIKQVCMYIHLRLNRSGELLPTKTKYQINFAIFYLGDMNHIERFLLNCVPKMYTYISLFSGSYSIKNPPRFSIPCIIGSYKSFY